ncbi:HAD hydrolase family protein [Streptomyces sp. NPDC006458]|uniref:HAD family hydrolase n=1 Tax=Streptomyces sp. NPDC006458 TaxID=3154302 RepID=UPI0033AE73D1
MIIACDLDGTLTDDQGVISASNASGLRRAKEHGATCVLATSRPSRCLDLPKRQLALFDCVLTCDGAERVSPDPAGVHLPLASAAVQRLSHALRAASITGAYAVEFGTNLGHEDGYTGWPATDTGPRFLTGPLHALCAQGAVARVFFRPDPPNTARAAVEVLAAAAGDDITFVTSEQPESTGLVQISGRAATKGAALRAWLTATRRQGRLIAFGDQLNDLSLLDLADDAFAVGDAHPELLRRYTHLANDDSAAVARAIHRILTPLPRRSSGRPHRS